MALPKRKGPGRRSQENFLRGDIRLLRAVAIARTAGFRMLVMSRIRHAAIVP
jgi:hypothetical protein